VNADSLLRRVLDTVQPLREASVTGGLDLYCWLNAEGTIRVHLGHGQVTTSDL